MAQFYVNREWVDTNHASIPLNEAGFLRGDGIFESILIHQGTVFRVDDHLQRLFEGIQRIRIRSRETQSEIKGLVKQYVQRNELETAVLRIIITRGIYDAMPWNFEGPNSLYITHSPAPRVPDEPAKIVFFPEENYPLIRKHPAVKSLNYLGNMLAKMDANDQDAFEPVLYNTDGYITEGGIRNVFFVKDGVVITPPLHLGILPGTMRESVLEVVKDSGFEIEESLIPVEEVETMDEAFLTSTTMRILPVYWDNWDSNYNVTKQLQSSLNALIEKTRERL
jgi:branched-chain amino acid aminotransferase